MNPERDEVHIEEVHIEQICQQLYPRLVAGFRAFGLTREDAEDTAQDALAKLFEVWGSRRPENPLAWCYAVGRNAAASRRRRRTVEARVMRLLARRYEHEVDVSTNQAVRKAVQELPTRQREAVIHRAFLEMTVKETAASMRCATGTVTALTHQALTSLRSRLLAGEMEPTREAIGHDG